MREDFSVIIVGGGFAGLAAADALLLKHSEGHVRKEIGTLNITILEARDRVGGRCLTKTPEELGISSNGDDETLLDCGAEWFDPDRHRNVADVVRLCGATFVDPQDQHFRWTFPAAAHGETGTDECPVPTREQKHYEAVCAELDLDASKLELDQAAGSDTEMQTGANRKTFESLDIPWLTYVDERLKACGATRDMLLAVGFQLMGASAPETSALAILQEVALFGSASHALECRLMRLDCGAGGLAEKYAKRVLSIKNEGVEVKLCLNTFARAITVDDSGSVSVRTGKTSLNFWDSETADITADHVILALPVNVLAELEFNLAGCTSLAKFDELQDLNAGRCVKKWISVDPNSVADSAWAVGGCPVVESYCVNAANCHLTRQRERYLCAFGLHGELPELASKSDENERAYKTAWEKALRKLHHPDCVVQKIGGHDWCADPWSKGSWLAVRAGKAEQWYVLPRKWRDMYDNKFILCGADFATSWSGWVEGAIESGRQAAERVWEQNDVIRPHCSL